MYLPRIGLPKTKIEEFNRIVCEEAVSHYSNLQYTLEREAFEKKYTLLPQSKRKQQLENEIIKLIEVIDKHSFYGVDDFRNSYFQYIDDLLQNKTNFVNPDYLIGHITHAFLKNLQWNLQFSKQDYANARKSDGPDYVFLIQCTDVLQRFPEIEEMASLLACCDSLLDIKLIIAEHDKQEEKLSIIEYTKETDITHVSKSVENVASRKSILQQIIEELYSKDVCICDMNKTSKLAAYLVGEYEPIRDTKEKLQIKVDNRQFKLLYDKVKKKFHPIIAQSKIESDEFLLTYLNSQPFKSSTLSDALYKNGHDNPDKATPPKNYEVFIELFDKIP
jgi:hypothetical protein